MSICSLVLLVQLGTTAEPALQRNVASALGDVFVYHAVRRNPTWQDPGERDHAAARNMALLLFKLGPPAYAIFEISASPESAATSSNDQTIRVSHTNPGPR